MFKKILEKIIPYYIRKNILMSKAWLFYYKNRYFFKNLIIRKNTSDILMFRQVFMRKDYLLPELPKDSSAPLKIIDCGANVGYASIWFTQNYPNASIIAIEPEDNNYQVLSDNIKPYPEITALKNGIWIKKSFLKVVDKGFGESGFMIEEVTSKNESDVDGISIPDIMKSQKWDTVDIIKMDIEGTEKTILSHDISWMKKCKLLIIELHEEMMPGVTKVFNAAFPEDMYNITFRGENYIISHK